jgi:hypothetical protein
MNRTMKISSAKEGSRKWPKPAAAFGLALPSKEFKPQFIQGVDATAKLTRDKGTRGHHAG